VSTVAAREELTSLVAASQRHYVNLREALATFAGQQDQ
jgi:hypothetical protein